MKKNPVYVWVGLLLFALIVGGIAMVLTSSRRRSIPSTIITQPTPVESANFVLHILNASQERRSIDIKIYIDGELEIDGIFSSETPIPLGIPPRKTFRLQLEQGTHTIKAVSTGGEADLEVQFEIINHHWAILGYEYWSGTGPEPMPRQFEFFIQDEPIYFQ